MSVVIQKQDSIFPVGSIYMSVNNINPTNYFGGTWVPWGSGRIPIGVNTNDTSFNTVEKTGGNQTHQLTVSEMPKHTHSFNGSSTTTSSSGNHDHQIGIGGYASTSLSVSAGFNFLGLPENGAKTRTLTAGTHTHTVTTSGSNSSAGGSQAFDIMNPYITCYMWKRTA